MAEAHEHFGQLRSILQRPPSREVIRDALAMLDARHEDCPDALREEWLPYTLAQLAAWDVEGELDGARHCARLTLERWDPASLHVEQVEALFPRIEPRLRFDPEPFAPLLFEFQLRELFLELGSARVMTHLALPPALITWLRLAEGRVWYEQKSPYALKLYGHTSILANTRHECENFYKDRERAPQEPALTPEPAGPLDDVLAQLAAMAPRSVSGRGTGAWLDIGDWSDKHVSCLCCHDLGDWDQVRDFHDAHPWYNGPGLGDLEAETFLDYLEYVAGASG